MTHSMLSLAPRSALRDAVKSERCAPALTVASGGGQPEAVAAIAAPLEVRAVITHPSARERYKADCSERRGALCPCNNTDRQCADCRGAA